MVNGIPITRCFFCSCIDTTILTCAQGLPCNEYELGERVHISSSQECRLLPCHWKDIMCVHEWHSFERRKLDVVELLPIDCFDSMCGWPPSRKGKSTMERVVVTTNCKRLVLINNSQGWDWKRMREPGRGIVFGCRIVIIGSTKSGTQGQSDGRYISLTLRRTRTAVPLEKLRQTAIQFVFPH